jgi:hypothetical protein
MILTQKVGLASPRFSHASREKMEADAACSQHVCVAASVGSSSFFASSRFGHPHSVRHVNSPMDRTGRSNGGPHQDSES